jgi:hypothetical protein
VSNAEGEGIAGAAVVAVEARSWHAILLGIEERYSDPFAGIRGLRREFEDLRRRSPAATTTSGGSYLPDGLVHYQGTLRGDGSLLRCRLEHAPREFLQSLLPRSFPRLRRAVPAMVVVPQSFGDLLVSHPHALVSLGVFLRDGTFYPLDDADFPPPEAIFRERVFHLDRPPVSLQRLSRPPPRGGDPGEGDRSAGRAAASTLSREIHAQRGMGAACHRKVGAPVPVQVSDGSGAGEGRRKTAVGAPRESSGGFLQKTEKDLSGSRRRHYNVVQAIGVDVSDQGQS